MKEAMEGSQHNVWELSVDGVGSSDAAREYQSTFSNKCTEVFNLRGNKLHCLTRNWLRRTA